MKWAVLVVALVMAAVGAAEPEAPARKAVAHWEAGDAEASFQVVESGDDVKMVLLLSDDDGGESVVLMRDIEDFEALRDSLNRAIQEATGRKAND